MSNHMNQTLADLEKAIIADGVVDSEEVGQLRDRLYDDGIIDREEADMLFNINDAVSGHANDPAWQELFVQAISDHLLQDDVSPGEIDEDELKWLIERIEGDGKLDDCEKALLANLKRRATSLSSEMIAMLDQAGI